MNKSTTITKNHNSSKEIATIDSKIEHQHFSPIVSASFSGFISRLILHPTDTIKTRILNQKQFEIGKYRGFLDAFQRILKEEGILAFYRGLAPSLFLAAPAQAVYLSSYDYSKEFIGRNVPENYSNSFIIHFLSGLSAEALSCILWVPHDMLKERMQVEKLFNQTSSSNHGKITLREQKQQMKGHLFNTLYKIRNEGLINIYKGYGITLFSYAPMSGFYFLSYEKLKSIAKDFRGKTDSELPLYPDIFICSILGISIAAIITQPFDLVKTRYQIQRRGDSGEHAYKNSFDGFKKIIKQEGPRTLWKGTGARLIYTAPNAALIMVLYEYFKKL